MAKNSASGPASRESRQTRRTVRVPVPAMSAPPSGAKMNCPKEPAAVAMPKAHERFSGGTMRPSAAITMPKDESATPMPTRMPPPMLNRIGVEVSAIISVPIA